MFCLVDIRFCFTNPYQNVMLFLTRSLIFTLQFVVLDICFMINLADTTKCLKNDNLPEVAANVYYCEDPDAPECCELDREFTCCAPQSKKTIMEQLQLWGSLFGICFLVAGIWVCYRKDNYVCEGNTISQRLKTACRCCEPKTVCADKLTKFNEADMDGNFPKDPGSSKGDVGTTQQQKPTHLWTIDSNLPGSDVDSGRGSAVSSGGGSGLSVGDSSFDLAIADSRPGTHTEANQIQTELRGNNRREKCRRSKKGRTGTRKQHSGNNISATHS